MRSAIEASRLLPGSNIKDSCIAAALAYGQSNASSLMEAYSVFRKWPTPA